MPFHPPYQSLNVIRSPFTKEKIQNELAKIEQLIRKLKTGYVNQSITDMTQRYFTYLNRLSQTPEKIQSRAEWILKYSQAVRLKLAICLDECVRKEKQIRSPTDRDFLDIIESITSSVATLYASHYLSPTDHQKLHHHLTELRILASHVTPQWTSTTYMDIRSVAYDLHEEYAAMIDCGMTYLDIQVTYQKLHHLTSVICTHLLPSSK